MIIEDGKGQGRRASVDGKNRLDVHAEAEARREAIDSGKTWSFTFTDVDPTDADDYFVYLTYTGDQALLVTTARIATTVAGQLFMEKVTGTAAGITAFSPVSRNLGSAIQPTGTFGYGVDITGLTAVGDPVLAVALPANQSVEFQSEVGIILTPGSAFGIRWGEATGVLTGTLTAYEVSLEDN